MLSEVAGQLRSAVGDAGMLSRIAGDEFICLLNECTEEEATRLGERAQTRISGFRLEVRTEQYAWVGLNFGLASSPPNGCSTDELLHAASVATRQNTSAIDRVLAPTHPPIGAPYIQKGKTGPLALVK